MTIDPESLGALRICWKSSSYHHFNITTDSFGWLYCSKWSSTSVAIKPFLNPIQQALAQNKANKLPQLPLDNPIISRSSNNSRRYVVPASKTEQLRNSFFVQTVYKWNKSTLETVHASSADAYSQQNPQILYPCAPSPPCCNNNHWWLVPATYPIQIQNHMQWQKHTSISDQLLTALLLPDKDI